MIFFGVKRESKRALVLVDYSNWHYYLKGHGWRIDWARFVQFFNQQFSKVIFYYFEGIVSRPYFKWRFPEKDNDDFEKAKKKKNGKFKWIKSCGFNVVTKPINVVYDKTSGNSIPKCNFDVELTIQAVDKLNDYDELVLCSGDGDFIKLVKYIKGQHKTVIVMAPTGRTNYGLRKAANVFLPLAMYRSEFEGKATRKSSQ